MKFKLHDIVKINKKPENLKSIEEQKFVDKMLRNLKWYNNIYLNNNPPSRKQEKFIRNILPTLIQNNEPHIYRFCKFYNINSYSILEVNDKF